MVGVYLAVQLKLPARPMQEVAHAME